MLHRLTNVVVASTLVLGCQAGNSAPLETDDQRASYAIGLDVGNSLRQTGDHLDVGRAYARHRGRAC